MTGKGPRRVASGSDRAADASSVRRHLGCPLCVHGPSNGLRTVLTITRNSPVNVSLGTSKRQKLLFSSPFMLEHC